MAPVTAAKKRRKFDLQTFLSTIDGGRTIATFTKGQRVFAQGDVGDAVFYIQKGRVRLSVVSKGGKEATIGILTGGAWQQQVAFGALVTLPRSFGQVVGCFFKVLLAIRAEVEIKAHFKLREGFTVLSGLSNPLRNIEVTHARIVPNTIAGATSRLRLLMIATAMSTAVCNHSTKEPVTGTLTVEPCGKSSYPFIHAPRFPH